MRINGGTGAAGQSRPEAARVEELRPVVRVVLRRGQLPVGGLLPQGHRQLHRRLHGHATRRSICRIRDRARISTKRSAAAVRRTDLTCIRNFIFDNHAGDPGVTATGVDSNGNRTGSIAGQRRRSDRDLRRSRCRPTSARRSSMAGNSPCSTCSATAASASRRTTRSSTPNLTYDNHDRGEQFAIEGLTDSANFVAFYEKDRWQVRAAYNWRDEFLAGSLRRHRLAESRVHRGLRAARRQRQLRRDGQPDAAWSRRSTSPTRSSACMGATTQEVLFVTQTGPRYMIGARYKFGQ